MGRMKITIVLCGPRKSPVAAASRHARAILARFSQPGFNFYAEPCTVSLFSQKIVTIFCMRIMNFSFPIFHTLTNICACHMLRLLRHPNVFAQQLLGCSRQPPNKLDLSRDGRGQIPRECQLTTRPRRTTNTDLAPLSHPGMKYSEMRLGGQFFSLPC